MGMNMTEKILAKHAGLDSVTAGQLIFCQLDMVLANDVTAPPAIKEFEKIGRPVFDNTKIALVPDHFTPNKDVFLLSAHRHLPACQTGNGHQTGIQ